MGKRRFLVGSAIGAVLAASSAQAVPIYLYFTGYGTSGSGTDYFPTAPGTSRSLRLVRDSATFGAVASPGIGDYVGAVSSTALSIGDAPFIGGAAVPPVLYTDLLIRRRSTEGIGWAFHGVPMALAADLTAFGLSRYNLPVSTFTSDAFLTTQQQWNVPLRGDFPAEFLFDTDARGLEDPRRSRIDGIVTSVRVSTPSSTVPEPGTLALFCLGLGGIVLGARRRG